MGVRAGDEVAEAHNETAELAAYPFQEDLRVLYDLAVKLFVFSTGPRPEP
jgi:hypothetical protein